MGLTWDTVLNPTYNEVTAGSVMPADGGSIAASSTGSGRSNQGQMQSASNASGGNPFVGLVVFAILLALIMFVVHKFGGESDDFSNVRASAYNVLIISLIALAGAPLWKMAFGRLSQSNVPYADHVSSYVAAA